MRYYIFLIYFLLLGCSSTPDEVYENDKSHPYSDTDEAFMTQEPRTYREPTHTPSDFFFKSCSQTDNSAHFSKTSYICDDR